MRKLNPLLILALFAGFVMFNPFASKSHTIEYLSAQEMIEGDMLIVDIRRPEEWVETGVLPNALLLTFERPEQFLAALTPHVKPGQKVALICRTGNRTSRAAQLIAPALDQPVIDLGGGMFRLMGMGYQPDRPTRRQGCAVC